MPVSRKLISELRQQLRMHSNAKEAAAAQAYTKSEISHYGIKAPVFRELAKNIFLKFPLKDFESWRDTTLALWRGAKYREELHCAIEMTESKIFKQYQTLDALPIYEEFIITGAWWDLVDPVASHRIRHLLLNYPKVMKPKLKQWSKGENIWLRRASIICQLRLKENTNLELLYQCIRPSLASDEFFLQKAIGWALRDYSATDMKEIVRYVKENESQLSNLSKREALKHKLKD